MTKQGPGDHWDVVTAELRSYRELQQQTWGNLDNATLGRYLADEVSDEERHAVETALNNHPELRRVTELVRDVLGEFEPSVQAPSLLPFPQRRPARPTLGMRLRQRGVLAVAACLLLALGVSLGRQFASTEATPASEGEPVVAMAVRDHGPQPPAPPRRSRSIHETRRYAAPAPPRVAVVHISSGLQQLHQQPDQAYAYFRQAVELQPTPSSEPQRKALAYGLSNLTQYYLKVDDSTRALDCSAKLSAIKQDDPHAITTVARLVDEVAEVRSLKTVGRGKMTPQIAPVALAPTPPPAPRSKAPQRPSRQQILREALPVLLRGARHENREVRTACARALGKLGWEARAAAPLLKAQAERASSLEERQACRQALDQIRSDWFRHLSDEVWAHFRPLWK